LFYLHAWLYRKPGIYPRAIKLPFQKSLTILTKPASHPLLLFLFQDFTSTLSFPHDGVSQEITPPPPHKVPFFLSFFFFVSQKAPLQKPLNAISSKNIFPSFRYSISVPRWLDCLPVPLLSNTLLCPSILSRLTDYSFEWSTYEYSQYSFYTLLFLGIPNPYLPC